MLTAQIKAYEIQGVLQQGNAFNAQGLDHTLLVKIASTAVTAWLLGLPESTARATLSHAWVDGHPLRTCRQAPNTGPRKGWAAGDACMRAVHLNLLARANFGRRQSAAAAKAKDDNDEQEKEEEERKPEPPDLPEPEEKSADDMLGTQVVG